MKLDEAISYLNGLLKVPEFRTDIEQKGEDAIRTIIKAIEKIRKEIE